MACSGSPRLISDLAKLVGLINVILCQRNLMHSKVQCRTTLPECIGSLSTETDAKHSLT